MSERGFSWVDGGVCAPEGFLASGTHAGLKADGRRDLSLLVAESGPVPAAAVFTTNAVFAAPVGISRRHIQSGHAHGIVTNAGNANACTGPRGEDDATAVVEAVAGALGCSPGDVLVASTGVIGVPLPVGRVLAAVPGAVEALDAGVTAARAAAEAIITTDLHVKETAVTLEVDGRRYTVGGMAKGSGMIAPRMATMLGYVTTDAPLSSDACDLALRTAVERTFNRITVDSDTSTNDMVVLMASGAAGGPAIGPEDAAFGPVCSAIETVCRELAHMIVRDGEGATKFVTIEVRGALSEDDALEAAFSVANSPLVKTALFGGDANWGRVAAAVGKSSARVDQSRLEISFAGIVTCRDGAAVSFDEAEAAAALAERDLEVVVDLHLGLHAAVVWTCDLSYDYVRINADYRS